MWLMHLEKLIDFFIKKYHSCIFEQESPDYILESEVLIRNILIRTFLGGDLRCLHVLVIIVNYFLL